MDNHYRGRLVLNRTPELSFQRFFDATVIERILHSRTGNSCVGFIDMSKQMTQSLMFFVGREGRRGERRGWEGGQEKKRARRGKTQGERREGGEERGGRRGDRQNPLDSDKVPHGSPASWSWCPQGSLASWSWCRAPPFFVECSPGVPGPLVLVAGHPFFPVR